MKENKVWPEVGSGQLSIILNLESAGQLPIFKMSWSTYSILDFKNSYLWKRNENLRLRNTSHSHSKYTRTNNFLSTSIFFYSGSIFLFGGAKKMTTVHSQVTSSDNWHSTAHACRGLYRFSVWPQWPGTNPPSEISLQPLWIQSLHLG